MQDGRQATPYGRAQININGLISVMRASGTSLCEGHIIICEMVANKKTCYNSCNIQLLWKYVQISMCAKE